MEMNFNVTKIVEEIVMRAEENQEEFIIETIYPYCEDLLQIKINKEELKQILLNGMQKQQLCDDCISRAQALHACCDEWNKDYKDIMKSIRQLPSVVPQPYKAESEKGNDDD